MTEKQAMGDQALRGWSSVGRNKRRMVGKEVKDTKELGGEISPIEE